ncbi:MAG: response regulator [Candidatus Omnitrophota bacterium]
MGRRRILIIDDEPAFTEMVKLNLESTGVYQVKIENRSLAAVQTAASFNPELILLDVVMPEKEGPDILCQFKEEPLLRNVPVIFLTATIRKTEVDEQDGQIGGYPFLAKPCSVAELIETIEQHLPR